MAPLLLVAGLCLADSAAAVVTIHESFDTMDNADVVDPEVLWDTTAGELRLKPYQMSQAGALSGMPGFSVEPVVRGNTLFMASQAAGMLVMNVQNPASPSLVSVFGSWTVLGLDVEADLAAFASSNGTALVDVTDPAVPSMVWQKVGEYVGAVELVGNRLYVALNDSLRILDISTPSSPQWLGSVELGGAGYRMEVQGQFAYCARGDNLSIVDVSDPTNPTLVGTDLTASSCVDVVLDGELAYAALVGVGVRIYDVSDPASPVILSTYSPGGFVSGVAVSGNSLYAAWRAQGVHHLDVSDPANPVLVSTFDTPGSAEGVAVEGLYTYVADGSGLQVLRNATLELSGLRFYHPDGDVQEMTAQGQHLYLAEGAGGLSILSLALEDYATLVSNVPLGDVRAVAVAGQYAYVANGSDSFTILDVSDPTSPTTVFTNAAGIGVVYRDVVVTGHLAYLVYSASGLTYAEIVDIGDPTAPISLGLMAGTSLDGLSVAGGLAAFGSGSTLWIFDVSDPSSPSPLASLVTGSPILRTAIEGEHLYAAGGATLQSFNIANPASPALMDTESAGAVIRDLQVEGNLAWMATDLFDLYMVNVTNPSALVSITATPGGSQSILVRGDELYIARESGTLEFWRTMRRRYAGPDGEVRSINVNPAPDPIVAARLTPDFDHIVVFSVTANGSAFDMVTPGQWKYFAVPGSDVRWFAQLKVFQPGWHPVVRELSLELLYEFAQVESVADVGNDQGRQVRLTWTRSGYDRDGSTMPILEYIVFRKQSGGLAPGALARPEGEAGTFATQLAGWDFVTAVPAGTDDLYSVVVPTLADSTDTGGIAFSTFMVRAQTATPSVHFDSYPDSGYSVDNLAPAVPENPSVLYATGSGNQLSWDPPVDEDFQYFRIYRDTDPGFDPGPEHLVDATTGTAWTDPSYDATGVFYKISAVDFSGNESEYAAPSGPVVDAGGTGSFVLSLAPVVPNPSRSTTHVRFTLPQAVRVDLVVLDVRGRRVRSLVSGLLEAGAHGVEWDGRDQAGSALPSGYYLIRLRAANEILTRGAVRLR